MTDPSETEFLFEDLTPYSVIDSVEEALGEELTGFASPLPSYINRVYELEKAGGDRIIAKFYRPNRWSLEALEDEHDFVLECADDDISVVPPIIMPDGYSLGDADGIYFSLYEKRAGRNYEAVNDEDWERIGSIIGRVHSVGKRSDALHRSVLHPEKLTRGEINHLLDNDHITSSYRGEFQTVINEIFEQIGTRFDDVEYCRIHADCHQANILDRMEQGLVMIDFDDMMMGPPVQDLWLMIPNHIHCAQREFDAMIDGYEMFCDFDWFSLKLVESLRVLRIIYFLSWCSRQRNDFKFQHNFPDWGGDAFWRREIGDLRHQLNIIREDDKRRTRHY